MKRIVLSTGIMMAIAILVSACNKNDCDNGSDPNACACYAIYAPVCGCNGVTYENDCRAACAGIDEYTEGVCN